MTPSHCAKDGLMLTPYHFIVSLSKASASSNVPIRDHSAKMHCSVSTMVMSPSSAAGIRLLPVDIGSIPLKFECKVASITTGQTSNQINQSKVHLYNALKP
jgi:hypothetical protein